MENQKKKLKLSIAGMDERGTNTLTFFFQKFCNNRCEVSAVQEADATIVNMDYVDATVLLKQLEETYPRRALILTSIKQLDIDKHYFLRKPMIAEQLLEILDQMLGIRHRKKVTVQHENLARSKKTDKKVFSNRELTKRDIAAFVGDADDIDLRKASYEEACFFEMENYFAGYLRQAFLKSKREQKAVRLIGLWQPVLVFADSNQIYVEMSERQLKPLCVTTIESSGFDKKAVHFEVLDKQQALLLCKQHKYFKPLDQFLWHIALWTSRGRLPNRIPCDIPVYLSGWPNFTRVDTSPEALRICAFWILHPRTIINLTEIMNIPQRHIFSLITACYISGMTDVAKRQADTLILPSKIEPTIKTNFFMRIMNKLRNYR